jgi:DNA-binding MarR family transcriptional regulator
LRLLWEQDGLTQKELSSELGLTEATTVTAMDVMETRGLIQRRRNAQDRRKLNICLTPQGRALKRRLLPYAAEVNKVAVDGLSRQELGVLWELLERINLALDADYERGSG